MDVNVKAAIDRLGIDDHSLPADYEALVQHTEPLLGSNEIELPAKSDEGAKQKRKRKTRPRKSK